MNNFRIALIATITLLAILIGFLCNPSARLPNAINLEISNITDNSANLSWQLESCDSCLPKSEVVGFKVQLIDSLTQEIVLDTTVQQTELSVSSLQPDYPYQVNVFSVGSGGTLGDTPASGSFRTIIIGDTVVMVPPGDGQPGLEDCTCTPDGAIMPFDFGKQASPSFSIPPSSSGAVGTRWVYMLKYKDGPNTFSFKMGYDSDCDKVKVLDQVCEQNGVSGISFTPAGDAKSFTVTFLMGGSTYSAVFASVANPSFPLQRRIEVNTLPTSFGDKFAVQKCSGTWDADCGEEGVAPDDDESSEEVFTAR